MPHARFLDTLDVRFQEIVGGEAVHSTAIECELAPSVESR